MVTGGLFTISQPFRSQQYPVSMRVCVGAFEAPQAWAELVKRSNTLPYPGCCLLHVDVACQESTPATFACYHVQWRFITS